MQKTIKKFKSGDKVIISCKETMNVFPMLKNKVGEVIEVGLYSVRINFDFPGYRYFSSYFWRLKLVDANIKCRKE
jgi:hypothetical protein